MRGCEKSVGGCEKRVRGCENVLAGLALLCWFQGLVATILPAHERAKSGCAYGTMQRIFAPQESGCHGLQVRSKDL